MISVLIPLYQVDVSFLINKLITQLTSKNVPFEILIGDDSSDSSNPSFLEAWNPNSVKYFKNEKTLGRSANRNRLAEKAKYEHLLFIDCDAEVFDPDFISKYLAELDSQTVLCGGTAYQKTKPIDKDEILRWVYGQNREVHSSDQRNTKPYNSFSSFNFCIPKKIFQEVCFDEGITDYGHEDTYFGFALKEKGIPVKHISNPLIHAGLESSKVFIKKTEKSIEGLLSLSKRESIPPGFLENINLWNSFIRIKKTGFNQVLKRSFPILKSFLIRSLSTKNPSLFLFDLYKLAYLSKIQG